MAADSSSGNMSGSNAFSYDFGNSVTIDNNSEETPTFGMEQLQHLFKEQQRFLDYFFKNLNYEQVQAFTQLCLDTKGVIFFSGVGKSGFVAQKIAQTLVSTGTKAVFLSPTDALHGDIGIMGPKDILVLFSKSGATEELNRLAPCARARGAYLVGVSSLKSTNFRELCDMHVYLPLERELCPFDLAPVTSTAIQMLFGDTVAIALMQAKNLTREQYALNHPAGRIGKRLIFRVSLSVMLIYLRLLGSQFALPDDKKMLYL
jgi:arabinose-5-phosphate isomerase